MYKKILGLDLGTNSVGWALLETNGQRPTGIIDLGCRIFNKAVEEKTPTPKNQKRRNARLARRVNQRRARRKIRMLNYLVNLGLLPRELQETNQPEIILNQIGDPYVLRAKALDHKISAHELGRILLHFVQRRGFLSNRKTLIGDMIDDPDVQDVLNELEKTEDKSSEQAKEETAFKKNISELKTLIQSTKSPSPHSEYCRTLGEYLSTRSHQECKRNRNRDGGHLRTDRAMYHQELRLIWAQQATHHDILTQEVQENFEQIIFFQRPLKLRSDRIGKCSLEPARKRARMARLESQRFRYFQDINNLEYFEPYSEQWMKLDQEKRQKLIELFEREANITITKIRKCLGFDRSYAFNLERGNKKIKGNTTACEIREHFAGWDQLEDSQQHALVEDLVTFNKKSALKKRLTSHWRFDVGTTVSLCLMQLEPGHSNLSVKAINKLLPFLEEGQIYSDSRICAGYGYENKQKDVADRLGLPPEIPNPIVQRGLHELRRVVNAIIAEYGKPDAIRIEMARDLEMNTRRYQAYLKQQRVNTKANDEAIEKFKEVAQMNPHLQLASYPSYTDKVKYRLWKDQDGFCAYCLKKISLSQLFGPEIEIDHILPYSESLDDSYMNKVVCFEAENRFKGQHTPVDAYSNDEEKWTQITGALSRWGKQLKSKQKRFSTTFSEVQKRDFISSQLNDTRYISRVALEYLAQLGADITTTKGQITAWLRHQWGLNSLLGETQLKERTDHRHHAIDAVVIACVDRKLYRTMVSLAKDLERTRSELNMRDMNIDPIWPDLRSDCEAAIAAIIISHPPKLKLSGALHEETGVGFIEGIGNVTRVNLDSGFKLKQTKKIYDDTVRGIVVNHLAKYNNKPKTAFAEDKTVFHKDGKTPIKRVRIRQSKTTLKKLQSTKFGARNKEGDVFKWLAYGNLHHVEIIKDIRSGKYVGIFVTMMKAHRRAKGIRQPKEPIIREDHGEAYEFIMALHINDLVSIERAGNRTFYRLQKFITENNALTLRLHTASTLNEINETLPSRESTIPALMASKLQKHHINAIGKLLT